MKDFSKNTTDSDIRYYRQEIGELIEYAQTTRLVSWNDGLIFHEFIHALWRVFLKNENLTAKAMLIRSKLGDELALQLLAEEFNLRRNHFSNYRL